MFREEGVGYIADVELRVSNIERAGLHIRAQARHYCNTVASILFCVYLLESFLAFCPQQRKSISKNLQMKCQQIETALNLPPAHDVISCSYKVIKYSIKYI